MAIHCRIGLGHWPQPMIENYSGGTYDLLELASVLWVYFTLFVAGPVVLITLVVGFSGKHNRGNRVRVILYGLGWACLACVMLLDPTSFTEWWFD
jgi:hypothetical protein